MVSILARVNPRAVPITVEQLLAKPDPQTCELHDLSIWLPALDRAAVEAEHLNTPDDRKRVLADRKRALDACFDDDDRIALRQQHERTDARDQQRVTWHMSPTARLLFAIGVDVWALDDAHASPRSVWWCPCCQRSTLDAIASNVADGELPDQCFAVEHRHAQVIGNVVRATCLGGCTAEQLAAAIKTYVLEDETRTAREQIEREADELRAGCAPLAITAAQEWRVPGVIPVRALTLLVGPSGHGKSWAMAHLALCVASGFPWLGHDVHRGRVLWCALEAREVNERHLRHLATSLGLDLDALYAEGWIDFWPLGKSIKMDDKASRAELARFVRLRGYSLILIDNATQIRSGGSENDTAIVGAAMEPLAQLAQLGMINGERVTARPPAIVVLHHANKDGESRGSTAYAQHADCVITLHRKRAADPQSPIALAFGEGGRFASATLPLSMRFAGVMPEPVVPELVTVRERANAEPEVKPLHSRLLAAVTAAPGSSINAIAKAAGASKRDVGPALREMDARGLVELRDEVWYPVEAE